MGRVSKVKEGFTSFFKKVDGESQDRLNLGLGEDVAKGS